MNLSIEDQRLLEELCELNNVNFEKVLNLFEVVKEFEFKNRRTGVFEALKEVLKKGT